ncbi:MAG: NAD(P)/FAD-dependent oxidoreductase [Proteobacteria bacterium]|nr:NAD(P)/FAD-dependent oxidoreductase [Pseudomonadota bacterium]
MVEPIFDVIVIGTGIGGSSLAALSARAGLKTLVLEKNPRVGGSCSYYEKDGFQIDFGTHLFSRGNRGPIGEVLKRVEAASRVKFVHPTRLSRIVGLGLDIPFYTSLLATPLTLYRSHRQLGIPFREFPGLLKMMSDFFWMPENKIAEWKDRTVEEFVFTRTRHPAILSLIGVMITLYFVYPYWKCSAGEAIWCTQRIIKARRFSYPRGGAAIIPRTMLEAAQGHGATLLTQARVRKILLEKGAARGVELADGRKFQGRAVVSTSSLKDTVFNLVGPEPFPAEFRKKVEGLKESLNAIQIKLALGRKVIKETSMIVLGSPSGNYRLQTASPAQVRKVSEDLEAGKIPELLFLYTVVPSNIDPGLAPPGKQLLNVATAFPHTSTRPQDPPEAWVEAMMKTLLKAVPEIEPHILWKEVIGAQAIESWIGKPGGPLISTVQVPGQVGQDRPAIRSPIPGLYFAGDGAGARGIGTELAAQSAIECAEILDSDFRNGSISLRTGGKMLS